MEENATNLILLIALLTTMALAIIQWIRGRTLKKKIKILEKGKMPISRRERLLIALGLKKRPQKKQKNYKQGDISIRVFK